MGWVWRQVQLLPVWQVIEARGTEANAMECRNKLDSFWFPVTKHLGQGPGAEVELELDP